ncbi:MAG TPA: hypothetical protein VHF89_09860, partial [Solirubrobacteraceae bacterium]|nr:hypothetical protein [Solirubrobacteraceae bacterium]
MRLIQVPREGPVDEGREGAQARGEQARRQGGDEALEAQRAAERGGVRGAERGVVAQGGVTRLRTVEDGADLLARGDAEVERRADPLAGQREAVAGAVAGEERARVGRGAQAVREPVALEALRAARQLHRR